MTATRDFPDFRCVCPNDRLLSIPIDLINLHQTSHSIKSWLKIGMNDLNNETAHLVTKKLLLGMRVAGVGLGEVDYVNDTITLDARAAEIFDLMANVPIDRDSLHSKIHPDDWPEVEAEVDQMIAPEGFNFIEVEHRIVKRDESIAWVNARKQIEFRTDKSSGLPMPHSGLVAIIDITSRKNAENHVKYLMDEINHRSKNLMSLVQTIARMSADTDAEKDFASRFGDRIRALAFNQDALIKGRERHQSIDDLIAFHLGPFKDDRTVNIESAGPHILLKPDVAQAIGMALHELATNAAKYGALSQSCGQVNIDWNISGASEPMLTMSWREKGGPTVSPPTRSGFGQKVIKSMAAATVSGAVDITYDPAGVQWSLAAQKANVEASSE